MLSLSLERYGQVSHASAEMVLSEALDSASCLIEKSGFHHKLEKIFLNKDRSSDVGAGMFMSL